MVRDDIPDLAEPMFDVAVEKVAMEVFKASLPELVKELPILKYGKTAKDVFNIVNNKRRESRLRKFLQSLLDQKVDLNKFHELNKDEQNEVIEILISELDSHNNDLQSEALAYLFTAYVERKIHRLIFIGVSHELKNTNPLVFYFNVDGISVQKRDETSYAVSGAVHYLPSTFTSNSDGKLSFSSQLFLTNIGRAFYDHVYEPMAQIYIM